MLTTDVRTKRFAHHYCSALSNADTGSQVTIEIDTNPPEMKNPSGLQPPEEGNTLKGHIHKKFDLPASLLE